MTAPAGGATETGAANTDPNAGGNTDPAKNEPTTGQTGASETDNTDWKAKAEAAEADVAKWKALSRKNEDALKAERDTKAQANMSEAEKAIADAKAQGSKETAVALGKKLAAAEFKAECATAKVDLGDALELIDTSRFVGDDGDVDSDAIEKAVKKLAKTFGAKQTAAPGKSGGEFDGGSGAGTPITDEQLKKMSPAEITKALEEGKLKHLL